MYGEERYDPIKIQEANRREERELLMYLSHCKKPELVKVVQRLTDAVARLESGNAWLESDRRGEKRDIMQELGSMNDPRHIEPETVILPRGTRKVSIEL